jgi:hypothetical protein
VGLTTAIADQVPDRLLAAAVRAVYPRLEPELARLPEFVPRGGTAVDVGGWFGPWTQRLRRRADHVVTIEADPRMAAILTRAFPDVTVIQAACTSETSSQAGSSGGPGESGGPEGCGGPEGPGRPEGSGWSGGFWRDGEYARLWIPDNRLSGLASLQHRTGRSVRVPRVTLDSLGLTGVTFVKLDIEGHELHALRGARETIRRDRPTLLLELEERHHPVQPVIDLLADWQYEGRILDGDAWVPLATFPLQARQQATEHRLAQSMLTRLLRPGPRYPNSVLFRPE